MAGCLHDHGQDFTDACSNAFQVICGDSGDDCDFDHHVSYTGAPERYVLGDSGFLAALQIRGPLLRQIERQTDTTAEALACHMQACRDLAIVGPTERSRVLAHDSDRVPPLFRKPRVVNDQGAKQP